MEEKRVAQKGWNDAQAKLSTVEKFGTIHQAGLANELRRQREWFSGEISRVNQRLDHLGYAVTNRNQAVAYPVPTPVVLPPCPTPHRGRYPACTW